MIRYVLLLVFAMTVPFSMTATANAQDVYEKTLGDVPHAQSYVVTADNDGKGTQLKVQCDNNGVFYKPNNFTCASGNTTKITCKADNGDSKFAICNCKWKKNVKAPYQQVSMRNICCDNIGGC